MDTLRVIKADIMKEIKQVNRGYAVADLVFYFSKNLPYNFTQGTLLIAMGLCRLMPRRRKIVTEYVGEKYDPIDYHIKEFVVTEADLKVLLDKL